MLVGSSRGLVALLLVACVSCDSDFRPYNEVDGFRLLAIVAEPPELVPGGVVRLEALVVGDPAPSHRWRWCAVSAGVESGHRCAIDQTRMPEGLPQLELGTSTTAEIRWPTESIAALCAIAKFQDAPPAAPRLDCQRDRPEIYIELEVTAANGKTIRALTPLVLGKGDRPINANPRLDGVRVGAEPLQVGSTYAPSAALDLELMVPDSIAEIEGTSREIIRVTWFVEGGEVDAARTTFIDGDPKATLEALAQNVWTLPGQGDHAGLYLVVRDDRGGTSWLSRSVKLVGGAQ